MTDAIKVDGLAQFVRDLKKLDDELPKMVRLANNEAANLVIRRAVPTIPKRSGRAARSVQARSTRTAVRVAEGGNRAPYMPWLDFGGKVGRNHSVRRPFLKKGRYIYRAYGELRDSGEFQRVMTAGLLDVAASAGIEVD